MRLSLFFVATSGGPTFAPGGACQGRTLAHPLPDRLCRPAAQAGPGRDLAPYHTGGGDLRALTNRDMIMHADTRRQNHEILDRDAARNPGLRHQHAMTSDGGIVADLNQVVDLGSLPDHGIA